ncbi:MAG: succinate dehydrogenase/fumarate reductase iron-sulfur subunit [Bacteroidetes bacterium]|jgi:succinate dehydrogenase / fumarate reductase iron-sulfur subunit|nr:succinate dehydrogenase/fumarate reductase iron-sulfur subunit [Bacteroidota bacterium]
MKITLNVWRQQNAQSSGRFETYVASNVSEHMSFLEMLDVVNTDLVKAGKEPIAFDHDCREGVCGSCGIVIGGRAHGPNRAIATCQLHMRTFRDGDTITLEPWRAKAFPVIKDLMVDRTAMDRIMQAGGYVSVKTGGVPDGNAIPIPKHVADEAMDAAACIGCGACVAACPNGSAMLFVAAKVSQLALLPQGQVERTERVLKMVKQMDDEGFGNCSNNYACEAECPKEVSVTHIARLNREYLRANLVKEEQKESAGGA